ncbi:hypothetical protein PtA15_8A296 [Puccinia triticina]|uniref:Uncharacterized protein n=1 Tax=Puccinia triticina TaxID=208348 RepID=A0ABY7CTT5_9BASI|nr:uncharacterized protein PtA15_8A296 [Puccinia triticina]WAQ87392.1 hypothetical protein PtA15_8A296 [Puccinia triticina]WAR57246.1 hypothetical protein PtB15_8B293 [Puccinia triticina]
MSPPRRAPTGRRGTPPARLIRGAPGLCWTRAGGLLPDRWRARPDTPARSSPRFPGRQSFLQGPGCTPRVAHRAPGAAAALGRACPLNHRRGALDAEK